MPRIGALSIQHVTRASGDWVFVDIGFAAQTKSSGIAIGCSEPKVVHFAELAPCIRKEISSGTRPLNVLIEAPLSVAFNSRGNPTMRSMERKPGSQPRAWYTAPGSSVLVAATYLVRQLAEVETSRQIRLVEGFASFKPKGVPSSHVDDVNRLRGVAWQLPNACGRILAGEELKDAPTDRLESAFDVAGMDFGVPPVVVVDG